MSSIKLQQEILGIASSLAQTGSGCQCFVPRNRDILNLYTNLVKGFNKIIGRNLGQGDMNAND
jgi:hypothetical protein